MRMRRKRNLDQRLADCKDKLFEIITDELNFEKAIQNKEYIDFDKIFGNDNPTVLEIGCGKGKFACEYAKAHPEQNVIAVEKYGNVIVEACERAIKDGIDNLYFIKGNAEYLPKYIKDGSVERIFLNFSCPFPKNKYAIHRLTHRPLSLNIYRRSCCARAAKFTKKQTICTFLSFR